MLRDACVDGVSTRVSFACSTGLTNHNIILTSNGATAFNQIRFAIFSQEKNMRSVIKFRQSYVDFIALMSMVKKKDNKNHK